MRKRALMVIGRERPLATAMDLVQAGISVDVVGNRGSGRSTFLRALSSRLEERDWTVVHVRGVASLRHHALGALHLAGVSGVKGTRPATLNETAAALADRLRATRAVLLLDDWDDLDESSWGVAEYVRRDIGIPIVLSRLQGLRARHTPSGLPASTLEPSYVIDMDPLRFEEMEMVLENYLHAPIEAGTMSRLFAKSGGNIGLVLSLVDASIREQRMARNESGEWAASRDLWSGGLRAVLEAHLESLDDATRDALEIIAIVGVADLETVRKLIPWETLELLEERGTIAIVASGDRRLVTVIPPLLVEFFRHEPLTARRTRLTELIEERLGATAASAHTLEMDSDVRATGSEDALFVRLLQERARTRRLVTGAEWEASPSAASAVRYIRALMHSNSSSARESIGAVIGAVETLGGDRASNAEFCVLRAQWTAYVEGELDLALEQLEKDAATLGQYARLLDAARVRLLVNLRDIPEDFAARLEVDDDLPVDVKIALWETQMLVLVCLGRFKDARRVFAQVDAADRDHETYLSRVLMGLALLGEGEHRAGQDALRRGFDEAHGYLDIDALRAFGAALTLGYILAGDYAPADEILDVIYAAGEPAPYPPAIQLSLLTIGAVIAIRRGRVGIGERLASEAAAIDSPDGPLPAQARSWSRAQLLAFEGELRSAGDVLWDSGLRLWDRNARFAGITEMLSSLELAPDRERLTEALSRLAELPDALSLAAHAQFVSALVSNDPRAMLGAVDALEARGLTGVALSACKLAAAEFAKTGNDDDAAAARRREGEIRGAHEGRQIDTARFAATATALTEREKEIGRLAAEGLSNPEIASRLVLSVRTVESHIHRILRKLDVSGRHMLSRNLEAFR